MNDVFVEQLVKRKASKQTMISKICIIVIAAIGFFIGSFTFLIIPILGPIIILGVGFGTKWLLDSQDIEFEYVFTSGELDIDKVIKKKRRKQVISFEIKDIEVMAKYNNKAYEHQFNKATKVLNCSSGEMTDDTYVIIYSKDKEIIKIIIDPNEKVLKSIKTYGHSKVVL